MSSLIVNIMWWKNDLELTLYCTEEFWDINLGGMQRDALDDIMNGIIKEKLGIIPENVTWGGNTHIIEHT